MSAGPKVALVNLGCRVNRVELDVMALRLQEAGCELCGEREADAIVINTCAVTGEAQAKTRKAVRHAAGMPKHPIVVATGCVASLFPQELSELGEGVFVETTKAQVPQVVVERLESRGVFVHEDNAPKMETSEGTHTTPTGRTRPGIKIHDGCNNRCTYCIVWKARGLSRSVDVSGVLRDIRAAQERGAHEVVLTGINLGNYRSKCDTGVVRLPGLLETILNETSVERVRLSSIEPPDVTDELLSVMEAAGERVAPFLHVCLQSGSDRTLREMGRVYDTASYAQVVQHARTYLPDLSLGTDLIVGFPGEREEDFLESLAFCEQMAFSKMHVFRYSRRPGTPAAERDDQIAPQVIAERSAWMLRLADQMRHEQAQMRVGKEELVVVQSKGKGVTGGLFDATVAKDAPVDSLVRVRVTGVAEDATLATERIEQ